MCTVIGGLGARRSDPSAFGSSSLAVARRPITSGPVQISRRVVARFGLPVPQLRRDVPNLGSQPGHPAAQSGQFLGPGILAVLGRLRAVTGCNLAVVNRVGAVFCRSSPPRGSPCTFVDRALTVARGTIACGSIEITRRVVAGLRLPVAQLGREVAVLGSLPRLATAHAGHLVSRRILAVLRCLNPVFGRDLPVTDRLGPVDRSACAPRSDPRVLVCCTLAVTRSAVARGSVEISRRIVPRLGLSIAQLGREVTIQCSQPGLPAAHSGHLVDPGILPVPSGLGTICGCNLSIVDRLGAVIRCPGAARGNPCPFVSRALAVARRAIPRRPVEIACRVVASLGFLVPQLSRHITVLRRLSRLSSTHSGHLVGAGILAVLRGLSPILCCDLAVVDSLRSVVSCPSAPGGGPGTRVSDALAIALHPIPLSSVEVTRHVVACLGLSVPQIGLSITRIRGQITVPPLEVTSVGKDVPLGF